MKIAFFETPEEDKKTLQDMMVKLASTLPAGSPAPEAFFTDAKLSVETAALAADADVVSVFVNSEVRQSVIDALPKARLIATRSTGFDHIDAVYAKSKGIAVSTVPSYGSHTVAEFAFALILALSRRIIPAFHNLREDESFNLSHLMGFDLFGKTIAVIGTGKIGKNSARIAKGFGMNVVAYDLFPDQAFAAEIGATYGDLKTVLSKADVVTIHAPYTKETHHLISKEAVASMKKGSLLINTARGEIVDTDALVWGLEQGIIAGAGLDVLEGERYMKDDRMPPSEDFKTLLEDHMVIHDPKVIVTPHMAFFTAEAREDILRTTVQNILSFAAGAPQNVLK